MQDGPARCSEGPKSPKGGLPMRQLGSVIATALVFVVCAVQVAHANPVPTATYSASLAVNLMFAAPVGVAVASANDAFLPPPVCLTSGVAAVTQCAAPTSAFKNNTLTF